MLRINLLPIRQLKKRLKARNQMIGFAMVFIAVLVIMFFVNLLQTGKVENVQAAIAQLQNEERRLAPIIKEVEQLERQQKDLQRKIDVIKSLREESSLTVHVMDEVANLIDNDRMWLESFSQQGSSLQLQGTALDNETIAQFMEILKTSEYIQSVTLSSSTLKKVGNRDFKSYGLSCTVGFPAKEEKESSQLTICSDDYDMNKIATSFTDFLDNKYIPLESKFKILIAVAILVVAAALFYFLRYSPVQKKIAGLQQQRSQIETRLVRVKKKAQNRERLRQELAETERIFLELSELLPKEQEIPKLLKDISALGTNAGLDFVSFRPGNDIPKDFYAEIPVDINVNGPYHNLGFFLDQVSKLDRIVTVNNIKLGGAKMDAGEMLLNSSCKLVTYRFTNTQLAQKK